MMFARIHSRPTICSDDGRALGLEWGVQTAGNRNQKFWSNTIYFNTETEARKYCANIGAEIIGVSWL